MAKRIYISTNEASYFIDNSMSIGHNIPITGYHKVGDIVISNRQTDKIFGWVCIKEGEPGEWDVICDIRNIDNTVVNITKDVQDILSQLKNHKLIIDDINERIDDIHEQIDDLKEVDKDLQNQINGLKNEAKQNAADEKEIDDGLQDQIDDLKNKVNQNSSSGKEVTDGLQDQIDELKNEVKQNAAGEKEIDDGLQDQIDELKNEVKQNAAGEKEVTDGLQDQIDDLKEADGVLNEKIDEIKKGIVDALVEKGVDVDMNTSWKDLFDNIIIRIPQEIPCKGLTLNKDNVSLKVGETETIIATKTPVDSTDNIIWISGNTPIATVNMEGKITAIDAGDAIVTAICGSQVATCHVTVTVQKIPCTGLSLNKNSLSFTAVNNNQTIIATPTPSNTTDVVTWKSSNDSVAIVNNGVVTSKGEGSCTITATCGSKTATCNVVVEIAEQEIPCTSITLNKSTLSFNELTGTQTLIATIVPTTCNEKVTWKSSDNNVAVVVDDGTYDSLIDQAKVDISLVETLIARGIVTPKGEGSCTITATCGSKTANCNVTVEIEEPEIPEVDITVTQASVTADTSAGAVRLDMKEYFKLNNINIGFNNVNWQVQNTVGNIGEINTEGILSIPYQTEATGIVTATYGNKSASITVIAVVNKIEIPCTGLSLNNTSLSFDKLYVHQNLIATPVPSNTTDIIAWKSSNDNVATVINGTVASKGEGSCTITATCGSKTATCNVVVEIEEEPEIPEVDITVTQASVTVDTSVGAVTLYMKEYFKVNNIDINFNDLIWNVQNTSGDIGTINNEGALNIPYQTEATAVVTGSYGNKSASMTIIAVNGNAGGNTRIPCTGLGFTVSEVLVGVDRVEPYDMSEYLRRTPISTTDDVYWSTDNTNLVDVSSNGIVSIKGVVGSCNIIANCGDQTAQCPFIIKESQQSYPCTGLRLTQSTVNLYVGDTYNLGNLVQITPENCTDELIWTYEYNNIANFSEETTIVRALAAGTVNIPVKCGYYTGIIEVIVSPSDPGVEDNIVLSTYNANGEPGTKITIYAETDTNLSGNVTWASKNTNIATVDQNADGSICTITLQNEGDTQVTATCDGYTAICEVSCYIY